MPGRNQFFICHPDKDKSCGACCGLYNYEGFDRATVSEALSFRTDLFSAMRPDHFELDEFRNLVSSMDGRPKLLEEIYCCEFLGYLDKEERKVGCLIHPTLHNGLDSRDHAYYGAETCAMHKCGSYSFLSESEVIPVIAALEDWYLYGICVTDIDLIKEFYREVSDLMGEAIRPQVIAKTESALNIFSKYLKLKENWPFTRGRRRFGQYIFEGGTYRVAETDWLKMGVERPREWRILRSLSSDFRNLSEVIAATKIIRDLIAEMAEAL